MLATVFMFSPNSRERGKHEESLHISNRIHTDALGDFMIEKNP